MAFAPDPARLEHPIDRAAAHAFLTWRALQDAGVKGSLLARAHDWARVLLSQAAFEESKRQGDGPRVGLSEWIRCADLELKLSQPKEPR
jgi:hypothetical protein